MRKSSNWSMTKNVLEIKIFISCIWCAVSPNIISIRASRVFEGFGTAALQRYCSRWPLRSGQPTNSTSILALLLQLSSKYICGFIQFNVHKLPNLTCFQRS